MSWALLFIKMVEIFIPCVCFVNMFFNQVDPQIRVCVNFGLGRKIIKGRESLKTLPLMAFVWGSSDC